MKKKTYVILVDKKNNKIGTEEKITVHKKGLLHRAFSIFIFNKKDELLLQRRQLSKYHSPGLWSNTCCGHQIEGLQNVKCAKSRLMYEMGINCSLKKVLDFYYKYELENGMIEHEYDLFYIGKYNLTPHINTKEVSEFKWTNIHTIMQDINQNPHLYTAWFKSGYPILYKFIIPNVEIKKNSRSIFFEF
jgi:isopentenyl-diphosphate delta-isomerase